MSATGAKMRQNLVKKFTYRYVDLGNSQLQKLTPSQNMSSNLLIVVRVYITHSSLDET